MLTMLYVCPCGCGLIGAIPSGNASVYAAAISPDQERTSTATPIDSIHALRETERLLCDAHANVYVDCATPPRDRTDWYRPLFAWWRTVVERVAVDRVVEAA